MEQIAARVGLRFILNTVLDSAGRLVGVFAGDPLQAHRAGAALSERVYGVSIPSPAEIVVAGSHPCDIEFWQAHKSLYPADRVVTEGGVILVVTPCPEGVAVMHTGILRDTARTAEEIEARILSGEIEDVVSGALALAWAKMRQRASIFLVSAGISDQAANALGFRPFATVDAALQAALSEQGPAARVAVLTHAPDMLPVIGPQG
jgi:nickel-dependent lactate racemase